jgi:iron(III) transport system permease protein
MTSSAPARTEPARSTPVGPGRRMGRMERWLGDVPPLALLALLVALVCVPVASVPWMSLRQGLPGRPSTLSLANYADIFASPGLRHVLLNTLVFGAGTLLVAFVFLLPLVWLFNRTDLPFKQTFYVLITLGVLVPAFLRSIAWIMLLSPVNGLANTWLQGLLGLRHPPFDIYTLGGMAFVQGTSFVSTGFFMMSAAWAAIDPALEEAAQVAGLSRLRTFLRVNLPLTMPAILAVMIFLFMTGVSVFETPAIIGLPGHIFVLSSQIYFSVAPETGLPDYGHAGAYGLLMLVAGLALSVLYFRVVRRSNRYAVITGRGYRPKLTRLGRWKGPAVAFVLVYLALDLFIPFLILLWTSLLPYLQFPSVKALHSLSLTGYTHLLSYDGIAPFRNTLVLVAVAPAVAVALSVLVSWYVTRGRLAYRGLLDGIAFLPQSVPHILLAVGIAYLALVNHSWLPIYGTVAILVLAHAVGFMSYGTRTLNSAMMQIHSDLDEAGRVAGLRPLAVLHRVVVPLISDAVFNGWLWIVLLSYREVGTVLLLAMAVVILVARRLFVRSRRAVSTTP